MLSFKEMRLKAGFSQSKLAKLLGVDRTSVSKWDLGLSTPKLKTLLKLTKIFKCSFDELLNSFNYKIK